MSIGLLTLGIANASSWFSPGALSQQHAEIGDCGSCHQQFAKGPIGWIHATFTENSSAGSNSLCLRCHRMGQQPMQAHALPQARLRRLTASANAAWKMSRPLMFSLGSAVFGSPAAHRDGIACASCHSEHHGASAKLSDISNTRCQACHVEQFISFADGHPSFGSYPYRRRTRINFDHVTHARKYFIEARAKGLAEPETCASCHVRDAKGEYNVLREFGRTCAACHAGEIRGEGIAGAAGITMITLPGLDVETLKERGIAIGAWPELSDRKLTPLMRALFAGDPKLSGALQRFNRLDPMDLRKASDEDLAAVGAVAWACKALLYDLATIGPPVLQRRLAKHLRAKLDNKTVREMLGGLSLDVVRSAQQSWLPTLASDIARHRAGQAVPTTTGADATPDEAEASPAEQDDTAVANQARPASDKQGDILSGDKSDILSGDKSDILSGDKSDILSGDKSDILSGDKSDILSGDKSDILSSDGAKGSSGNASDLLSGAAHGARQATSEPSSTETAMPATDPEKWSKFGGWYRDFYALLYRPQDHADALMKSWITITGASVASAKDPSVLQLFEQFVNATGPGKCSKCHSIDLQPDGALKVNWRGWRGGTGQRGFTRFAHAPHFVLLQSGKGCVTCHVFDPSANYEATFSGRDPNHFTSNFKPLDRSVCSACHVKEAAGDSCTMCHNYHVGLVETNMPTTKMDAMAK